MTTQSDVFKSFIACIDTGDEDTAESLVAELSQDDEADLIQLATLPDETDYSWWAVRALADVGQADAVPVVAHFLTSHDSSLRATAALALGHLCARVPQAVAPTLTQVGELLQDDDGFVRQAAANGLSMCGDVALPAIQHILATSQHQGARTRAASAVRSIRTPASIPVLFRCLNDSNHLVHSYAREALDEMGLLDNVILLP